MEKTFIIFNNIIPVIKETKYKNIANHGTVLIA